MTASTHPIPAQLASDLAATLARLRIARTVGDEREVIVCELRLNFLLDRLPRKASL